MTPSVSLRTREAFSKVKSRAVKQVPEPFLARKEAVSRKGRKEGRKSWNESAARTVTFGALPAGELNHCGVFRHHLDVAGVVEGAGPTPVLSVDIHHELLLIL